MELLEPLKLPQRSVMATAAAREYSSPREVSPRTDDANATLERLLREDARKRDYGYGMPSWSVYFSGAPQTPHTMGQSPSELAISSPRLREENLHKRIASFRSLNTNFVATTARGLVERPGESPRMDPSAAAAETLADACDHDGDGHIVVAEIVSTLMTRPHLLKPLGLFGHSTELQIWEMFQKIDADGSGAVTKEELVAYLKQNQIGKFGAANLYTKEAISGMNDNSPRVPNRDFPVPLAIRLSPRPSKSARPVELDVSMGRRW